MMHLYRKYQMLNLVLNLNVALWHSIYCRTLYNTLSTDFHFSKSLYTLHLHSHPEEDELPLQSISPQGFFLILSISLPLLPLA